MQTYMIFEEKQKIKRQIDCDLCAHNHLKILN